MSASPVESEIRQDVAAFLADAFASDPDVTGPTGDGGRFDGKGVRWRGHLFAMPWKDNLAVKLTRDQVEGHCANGLGHPLVMGKRTMQEWLLVEERRQWEQLAFEARKAVVAIEARPKPRQAG